MYIHTYCLFNDTVGSSNCIAWRVGLLASSEFNRVWEKAAAEFQVLRFQFFTDTPRKLKFRAHQQSKAQQWMARRIRACRCILFQVFFYVLQWGLGRTDVVKSSVLCNLFTINEFIRESYGTSATVAMTLLHVHLHDLLLAMHSRRRFRPCYVMQLKNSWKQLVDLKPRTENGSSQVNTPYTRKAERSSGPKYICQCLTVSKVLWFCDETQEVCTLQWSQLSLIVYLNSRLLQRTNIEHD